MAPAAVTVPNLLVDPGFLFWAPVDTVIPTMTALNSKFNDPWPAAWLPLGATVEGSTFSYEVSTEAMRVAELFDPVKYATTERTGSLSFALADWSLTNLKRAMNGGTIAPIGAGTGATAVNGYTLPTPGQEVRCKLGWESADSTVRLIVLQALSSGTVEMAFQKAPDFSRIPFTFNMEVPSGSSQPFEFRTAGVARA